MDTGYCTPCTPNPIQNQVDSAGLVQSEIQKGCAVASADASACTTAAAEALSQLEFERALTGYGSFDTSTGLVVATAGRSASVHAALLAAVERGSIRSIVVAEGRPGMQMAWALEAGIEEQQQARIQIQANPDNSHMMSHAGVTAAESEEWSAAIRGGNTANVGQNAEDQDWAALQSHLGLGAPETSGNDGIVAVDVASLSDIREKIAAGKVHVILAGADSVDPSSGTALLSFGCDGISKLAEEARHRQPPIPVLVLSLAWAQGCDPQGRHSLPSELRSRLVGLPPKQIFDESS